MLLGILPLVIPQASPGKTTPLVSSAPAVLKASAAATLAAPAPAKLKG
jgi:hypothetical protein